jgi:glycosyltransferase involved in cell wall biosynthesis
MREVGPQIKVAYFVPPSRHFAGVERVVHELATGLAELHGDSFDVHVIFSRGYDEEVLRHTAYRQHVLGVDRLLKLPAAVRACVEVNRFDVLICPQVEASVLTWLATRGLELPVFLAHLHGNPRVEEARGSRSTRAAFLLFRHVVARRISGILAVSPSLERYVKETMRPGVPVVFVPNPVRDFDVPERTVDADGAFRFVTVARLSYQKGQDVLLRATALARDRLRPFRLTLVGAGPDELQLKALSSTLGLNDVVEFAGYTTDPARKLADADCFVLPSRWEGFGLALVEAMRFGLPVLATDCEFGPADVLTSPSLGELVKPDDPASLADGLVRMAARDHDPAEVALRRAAADRYSRPAVVSEHASALRRFAQAARRPSYRARAWRYTRS